MTEFFCDHAKKSFIFVWKVLPICHNYQILQRWSTIWYDLYQILFKGKEKNSPDNNTLASTAFLWLKRSKVMRGWNFKVDRIYSSKYVLPMNIAYLIFLSHAVSLSHTDLCLVNYTFIPLYTSRWTIYNKSSDFVTHWVPYYCNLVQD